MTSMLGAVSSVVGSGNCGGTALAERASQWFDGVDHSRKGDEKVHEVAQKELKNAKYIEKEKTKDVLTRDKDGNPVTVPLRTTVKKLKVKVKHKHKQKKKHKKNNKESKTHPHEKNHGFLSKLFQ